MIVTIRINKSESDLESIHLLFLSNNEHNYLKLFIGNILKKKK